MVWSAPRTWVTSEVVTAAHMNQEIRDNFNAVFPDGVEGVSWSPMLEATTTDPSATVTGVQYRTGARRGLWARFVLSAGGSGDYFVTLPEAASGITGSAAAGKGQNVGHFSIRDDSPPHMYHGAVELLSSTTVGFFLNSSEAPGGGTIQHDNPRTWASGDVLSFHALIPTS